jgi:TPR repeat protein
MPQRSIFLRSAVLALVLVVSDPPSHSASKAVAGLSGVALTPAEIRELQEKANRNDKEAIMRLGGYYVLVRNDPERASIWYSKLAATGDADGLYGFGNCRMKLNDFETARKALELAKAKGHPYADAALEELQRKVAAAEKNRRATPKKL